MTRIRQWLDDVQIGRLSLGDLVTRINERGRVEDPEHLSEMADLEALLRENKIDPRLYRAVRSKLGELQGSTVTRTRTPIVPPASDERTVFTAPPPAATTPAPPKPAADADDDDDDPLGRTIISPESLRPRTTPPRPATTPTAVPPPAASVPVSKQAPPAPSPVASADERTVFAASAPADDRTRMSEPDEAEDEATQMLRPGDLADERTRLLPPDKRLPPRPPAPTPPSTQTAVTGSRTGSQTSGTGTGTGTGGTSGASARSWQKLAEADAPVDKVDVGTRLKDRFVLEKQIGTGGMGVVFLAVDERKIEARDRNPRVAVKILNDEFRRHPDSLIALQRESRRSQQLAHDNIVRVYDFDKDGSTVFMTMEYVDGEDLKNMIRNLDGKGMSIEKAFPIIEGMGRALERAHREGVVHSDFKPGNVMLTATHVPKVFDFGIARAGKQRSESSGEQTVFDAGTLGALTPAYASLEMLQGRDPEPPDDLYALACVVYEMLGGRHPFNKINAEQAMKQGLVPQRIPSLSKLQWRTLAKGLAFRREDRIATAAEFIEGLRPRTQRERTLPLILAGAGGLVGMLVLIWLGNSLYYSSKVSGVEDCIGSSECADVAVLSERLKTLDAEDQKRITETRRDEIKGIFYGSLARHWAPEKGAYNYAAASKVVALAFGMYGPDSAWVKELGDGLEAGRNTQLSRLNDSFSAQIDKGVFLNVKDDGRMLIEVLEAVRTIDPAQPLLKDGRIGPAFERGIRGTLREASLTPDAQLDLARKRLDIARKYVPNVAALKPLEADLQTRSEQIAAMADEHKRVAAAKAQRQQRTAAVTDALNAATDTPEWRARMRSAWLAARESMGEDDAELNRLGITLSSTLLSQSTRAQSADNLVGASESVRLGLELLPGDDRLDRQFKSVSAAHDRSIAAAATEADRLRLNLARFDELLMRPAPTIAWLDETDKTFKAVDGKAQPDDLASRRDRLVQALDKLVSEAVAASDFAKAEPLALRAAALDPANQRLAALPGKVVEGRRKVQATQIAQLGDLVKQKSFTPEWQKSVDGTLAALRGVQDPTLSPLLDTLANAYAERAQKLAQDKSYAAARQMIAAGTRVSSQSTSISAAREKIDQLEKQDQATVEQQQAQFKVQELERTIALKSAAAEINDAIAALRQLRALDPKNVYGSTEAPKQIAEGALKLAERFASKNDYENAIKAADRGLEVLRTSALSAARVRYEVAGCGLDLERETRKRGTLPEVRRATCLAQLKKNDPTQYNKYKGLEGSAPAVTPPTAAPAPVPVPVPVPPAQTAPALAQPAPATAPQAPRATGPDPCKKKSSGQGTRSRGQCADDLADGKGPTIVVVAGLGTFGITQSEISNNDYARYCRASGQCVPPNGDPYVPVTRVSANDVRGFAQWISITTGRRYRLPNENEWRHAATVGGRDPLTEGYCRVTQGDRVISTGPRQTTAGVMNDWGLVNTVGNVWELVDNGGSLVALGGSFQDEPRDCDAEARRAFSGADEATGFRLVRELD